MTCVTWLNVRSNMVKKYRQSWWRQQQHVVEPVAWVAAAFAALEIVAADYRQLGSVAGDT